MVFDVGGVLIRWDDRRVMDEVARRLHADRERMYDLLHRFRPALQAGRGDVDAFWEGFERELGREVAPSVRALWWRLLEREARPRTDVLRWAGELRGMGFRTALFSNTDASHRRYFSERWGRDFSPRLLSYELGVVKPAPEAFRRARAKLGARASEICLLDDVGANVRAAQADGWRGHKFQSVAGARRFLQRLGWLPRSPRARGQLGRAAKDRAGRRAGGRVTKRPQRVRATARPA